MTTTGQWDPLGRAAAVLRLLAEHPQEVLGVRAIARELEMQPSTVSRLVGGLRREGLVSVSDDGVQLGLELLRLGRIAIENFDVRRVARPIIADLAAACDESIFLGVFDYDRLEMIRVDSVPSSKPLRYVVSLSVWTDVFRGASGLAIAAFLPPEERDAVLARADAVASADQPWLERERLESLMDEIRAKGYACTHGRRVPGAVGVAAPYFGAEGRVVGDVIVTVPELRFEESMETELAGHVRSAAADLTRALGGKAYVHEPARS